MWGKATLVIINVIFMVSSLYSAIIIDNTIYLIILSTLAILFLFINIYSFLDQEKKEKMSKYTGILKPKKDVFSSNKLLFSIDKEIHPILEIGNSGELIEFRGKTSETLFKSLWNIKLVISKKNGDLKLSTEIRSKNGLVGFIENNEWKVHPTESFDRNYNKNALEVIDKNREVVLQVRVLEDRIQFQGIFYDNTGLCTVIIGKEGFGGVIGSFRPGHYTPFSDQKIEPIFKYPSELHLGEMIQPIKDDHNTDIKVIFE